MWFIRTTNWRLWLITWVIQLSRWFWMPCGWQTLPLMWNQPPWTGIKLWSIKITWVWTGKWELLNLWRWNLGIFHTHVYVARSYRNIILEDYSYIFYRDEIFGQTYTATSSQLSDRSIDQSSLASVQYSISWVTF